MKKITLICLLMLGVLRIHAQGFSEEKALEKAKRLGVAPVDYAGFIKHEKEAFLHPGAMNINTYKGSYCKLLNIHPVAARTASGSLCGNLDFENGNYSNWSVFTGSNASSLGAPVNVSVDINPGIGQPNPWGLSYFNTILDSANSFANVPPAPISMVSNYTGKHISRVNHAFANGYYVGIQERQITVTANQPYLNFSYAVFLDSAGHTAADQPYINIALIDANNAQIPGTLLNIVANTQGANPGFISIVTGGVYTIYYKPWTPVTYDLTAYIGQTLTFQVIAADCAQGGHGGHAYIDFDCGGPAAGVANVWPGDANYDLTVDYLDLFYVGAGFGLSGTARASTGNSWNASPSNNWNQYSLYLSDAKHADCDGNGTVGFSDTTAIYQNYGLTHAFKSNATYLVAEPQDVPEILSIQASVDSVYADQTFTIDFNLGNPFDPIDSIYAIGFTVDFPSQLVNNAAASADFSGNIFEDSQGNSLHLFKKIGNSADVAVTRVNHQNVTYVEGKIASLQLTSNPVIINDYTYNFTFSNMKAITESGKIVELAGLNKTLKFKASNALGITTYKADDFSLFPNPAQTEITMSSTRAAIIKEYEIISICGMVIKQAKPEKGTTTISISDLDKGSYLIKLKLDNGSIVTKHFVKL